MPSIGKLLSLNGGLPERVSSTDNATLTGDVSGLGAITAGSLTAFGAVDAGSLAVSGNADISGSLDLSGALTSSSTASFSGALDAGSAVISGNLDVSGSFDLSGAAVMSSSLDVTGATTLSSTLAVTGDSIFSADVMVSGDLSVNGKIISRLQTDVVIKDAFLDLAFGNSTSGTSSVASQAGGFTIGQARNTNFTAGNVTDFPSGTSFTYADAGSSTPLAAGDVVAISGLPAEYAENEGYFVVASVDQASFPQTVTIESALQASLAWAQTSFTSGTPASAGSAWKPNLSVLAIADGSTAYKPHNYPTAPVWPVGTLVMAAYIGSGANGATKSLFQANGAYVAVGAGTTTLQNAYENGETITTNSTDGNVVIAGDQALVVSATNGVDISGQLDVSGALNVDGAVDMNSTLNVQSGAIFQSTVDISGATDISGALTVTGATILQGTLTVNSAVDFDSSLDVSGALTLDGAADLNSTLNVQSAADFQSTVDISGALTLDGAADFNSTLDVQSGATFQSTVDISGSLDVSGAMTVTGASILQNTLTVNAAADFDSTVDISGALTLDGVADFNSTLDVQGHAEFQSSVDISGALAVDGTAQFKEEVGTIAHNYGGSAIVAGAVCASVGGARGIKAALADDAVNAREWRVYAVAVAQINAGADGFVASVPGTYCTINLASLQSGTAGDPVYLSASSAGTGTLTAPSSAGNAVSQIGYLAADIASASSAEIVLAPQFIAAIPAV